MQHDSVMDAMASVEIAEAEAIEARQDATEASRHHDAALATFNGLVAVASAGRRVSRKEVVAAHAEVDAAARWASFASAVARARSGAVERAQDALIEAQTGKKHRAA